MLFVETLIGIIVLKILSSTKENEAFFIKKFRQCYKIIGYFPFKNFSILINFCISISLSKLTFCLKTLYSNFLNKINKKNKITIFTVDTKLAIMLRELFNVNCIVDYNAIFYSRNIKQIILTNFNKKKKLFFSKITQLLGIFYSNYKIKIMNKLVNDKIKFILNTLLINYNCMKKLKIFYDHFLNNIFSDNLISGTNNKIDFKSLSNTKKILKQNELFKNRVLFIQKKEITSYGVFLKSFNIYIKYLEKNINFCQIVINKLLFKIFPNLTTFIGINNSIKFLLEFDYYKDLKFLNLNSMFLDVSYANKKTNEHFKFKNKFFHKQTKYLTMIQKTKQNTYINKKIKKKILHKMNILKNIDVSLVYKTNIYGIKFLNFTKQIKKICLSL